MRLFPHARVHSVGALCMVLLALTCASCLGEISDNMLENPSFEDGFLDDGIPIGWSLYAGQDEGRQIKKTDIANDGEVAVIIYDDDPSQEIGITQSVPAKAGECYEAAVMVRQIEGASTGGSYLQFRYLPSNEFKQVGLAAVSADTYNRVSVKAVAPPGTTKAVIYLYSHRGPIPKVMVDSVSIVSGVEPPPPPPPPAPEPIPPVYDELKDLHLATALVQNDAPNCAIVAPASGRYDDDARRVQQAIRDVTGVEVPIISDEDEAAAVPIKGNLIALGNRSTNATIGELYNRYYCLLDLKYPGPAGSVVRTLHNPFGDGNNVIFAGGSDDAGVNAAAQSLATTLGGARWAGGRLTVGRLMEIKLGEGVQPPDDVREMEMWGASRGYGSTGYFGWCSISKQAAMYYMTGNPRHAREFLRLSFPDAEAKKQISEVDGERIENKDDPLAGFYHYNAHMAILFWDLIEESDVFTDEERLKVTNAFSRQLNHRKNEGIYRLTRPSPYVGSRHGQWSAISLYCLGRYFDKDYPDPIWAQCVRGAHLHFAPLAEHAWVYGESDNLFWYSTGTAPILSWMLLSGDRKPLESGTLATLLKGQEILISGREPDWALNSASMGYLNKAAYLMQDGRWVTYRKRTGVDTNVFRLGQSYWPEETLQPAQPTDLLGKWSIHPMPEPAWASRGTGFPRDESYYFGSYRSTTDETGDFVLIDGYNGASRNPYHTLVLLELRLAGDTLLKGYRNQVLTRADGLVEPQVAMDAALRWRDVVGDTAAFVADVPKAAYCNWRRNFAQRTGQYALVIDDLTFRTDSDNLQVQTLWETGRGIWHPEENTLEVRPAGRSVTPPGWQRLRSRDMKYTGDTGEPGGVAMLDSLDMVLLRAKKLGDWLEFEFDLEAPVEGEVFAQFLDYVDRGSASLTLDDEVIVPNYNNYAESATDAREPLGRRTLQAGKHTIRLEVVGWREGSDKCYIGFKGLLIRPANAVDAPQPMDYEIRPSDLVNTITRGRTATMEWVGPVRDGDHRIFFSLIGRQQADERQLACNRIAANAAALALPDPALAVVGDYEGVQADFALLASSHLFAHNLTLASAGERRFLASDKPVDVSWDFETGAGTIVAPEDAVISIDATMSDEASVNGAPMPLGVPDGQLMRIELPAGRYEFEGIRPSKPTTDQLAAVLTRTLEESADSRVQQLAEAAGQPKPTAPPLQTAFSARVKSWVVDQITIPSPDGELVCAAEDKQVHIINQQGEEVRTLTADGKIRVLHWWPEHKLLLVGCKDEKVIAFDEQGNRKWEFTSVMDPAVFRAAKTYWFKSAPGHEGVHGLSTGTFIDGETQCFVGSACTLEIIDGNGKLVHRMPIFWGPGKIFQIIDAPDGSLNLLIAREPTDGEVLAIVNNKTLTRTGSGYNGVPAGHRYVGSWAQMSRDHIFYVDMDGDGTKEVFSEINGVWNRVTVWSATGAALASANFGPGERIPTRNIRDVDVTDFNGDGKKEIVVAIAGGLVVALDNQCNRLWSRRLDSPPTVLMAVTPKQADAPVMVVGCEDGTVAVLDSTGELTGLDSIDGRPVEIGAITLGAGNPGVLMATNKGAVKAFAF